MDGATTPTVYDAIDAGLRLDLSARATLKAWRDLGGHIRTADFFDLWHYRARQLAEVGAVELDAEPPSAVVEAMRGRAS